MHGFLTLPLFSICFLWLPYFLVTALLDELWGPLGMMLLLDHFLESLLVMVSMVTNHTGGGFPGWILAPARMIMAEVCLVCCPEGQWRTATMDVPSEKLSKFKDSICVHCRDQWQAG